MLKTPRRGVDAFLGKRLFEDIVANDFFLDIEREAEKNRTRIGSKQYFRCPVQDVGQVVGSFDNPVVFRDAFE